MAQPPLSQQSSSQSSRSVDLFDDIDQPGPSNAEIDVSESQCKEATSETESQGTSTVGSELSTSSGSLLKSKRRRKGSAQRRIGRVPKMKKAARRKASSNTSTAEADDEGDEDDAAVDVLVDEPQAPAKRKYKKRSHLYRPKKYYAKKEESKVDNMSPKEKRKYTNKKELLTSSQKSRSKKTEDLCDVQASTVDLGPTTKLESLPKRSPKVSIAFEIPNDKFYFSIFDEIFEDEFEVDDAALIMCATTDDDNNFSPSQETQSQTSNFDSSSRPTSQQNLITEIVDVEWLAAHMKELLSETSWIVDTSRNIFRLSLLGPSANVFVERAVSWSDGTLSIYMYNKPVPQNCFLWETAILASVNLVASLEKLTMLLGTTAICKGVLDYEDYWNSAFEDGQGSIEGVPYHEQKCFRTSSCHLAVVGFDRCTECQKQKERFRKRKWKNVNVKGTDTKKTSNTNLDDNARKSKLENLQKNQKKKERDIRRMKMRVAKLISKDAMPVDEQLGKNFVRVLNENVHKMTDVEKMVWQEQAKALARQNNPRSMRWNPNMIKIALRLQSMVTKEAYDYLRDFGILRLPAQRTLYDYTHFIQSKEGIQKEILNLVAARVKGLLDSPEKHFFNVVFDEITVKSDIVTRKSGEIIGFINLDQVSSAVAELESEMLGVEKSKEVAKKVLTFMIQGIGIDLNEVVAIFPTFDLSSLQIYKFAWDVVFNLEIRDFKILSLICDGAGCNKAFFKMHSSWKGKDGVIFATRNIACGEFRPLFFIVDPPHLLKSLRNCLSNSYSHTKTRKLWKNGQTISWTALEKLVEVTSKDKFKDHKLTKEHILLTPFSRMKVSLACQVMSKSVAEALKRHMKDPRFGDGISMELIQFIEICNNFFDCLNGSDDLEGKRNKKNAYLWPYASKDDKRFSYLRDCVLKYFEDWNHDVKLREGSHSKTAREKMFISSQSFDSIQITVNGFCGAVKYLLSQEDAKPICAKKFNQDKLEQKFGMFRMAGGGKNNPTVDDLIRTNQSLFVQQSAAVPGKKGSTTGEKRVLQLSDDGLPKRVKK